MVKSCPNASAYKLTVNGIVLRRSACGETKTDITNGAENEARTPLIPFMKKALKFFCSLAITFSTLFVGLYLCLYFYSVSQTECNVRAGKEDILIFAPHCDDGVIIAGGYALQIKKNGGKVKVAFLTGNSTRLNEANNAWSLIGLEKEDLIRLDIDKNEQLSSEGMSEKIQTLRNLIIKVDPDTIFIPLYEGGHIDHDITNYLVSTAVKSSQKNIRLYESPEYNYYFSLRSTPEKFLDVFSRLIPFFEYHAPPSFLEPDNGLYLCMTAEEIELKKKMLREFVTQQPKTLVMHFGFNDRFKPYVGHDYYSAPHDYGNFLVYKARYSGNKWLRLFFSRPYWKLLTIHTYENRRTLDSLLTSQQ